MASLTASRSPFSFLLVRSRRSPPSSASLLLLHPPKRAQEPLSLRLSAPKNPALGLRGRRSGVRGSKDKDDGFEDLEAEIFNFMEASAKPGVFPTRRELIAAGRADLADAIAAHGGWLAFGWDSEEQKEKPPEEDARVSQQRLPASGLEAAGDSLKDGNAESSSAVASSSGRSMEMERKKDGGIEGILSQLEKERSVAFGFGTREKKANGSVLRRSREHDPGGADICDESGSFASQSGVQVEVNGMTNLESDWTSWSLKRTSSPLSEFEAAEIVCDGRIMDDENNENKVVVNAERAGDGTNIPHSDAKESHQSQIQLQLQHLESELTLALKFLRSKNNGVLSNKDQKNSLMEWDSLTDAWELQENEIMNARNKLRSIRAKLAVLEGKMTLEIIEAPKTKDDRQRRLVAAQNALKLLRTICIIWANPASEVFVAGSFDGWTSQRKMEKSSASIFYLYLKLYPGRYEIKFIVDGIWHVDPLHPTVHNNGHENNLLLID